MSISSNPVVHWNTACLQHAHNRLTQQRSCASPLFICWTLTVSLASSWVAHLVQTRHLDYEYILVTHHILPTFCSITSLYKVNTLIIYSATFGSTTRVPSTSPLLDCGILCPLIFDNLKHSLHSDAFWRHATFSLPILTLSALPMHPDSLWDLVTIQIIYLLNITIKSDLLFTA